MSVICGTMADAADLGRFEIWNQPVSCEWNRNRPIRIRIESRSFTGP